jgi:hypothetical protein
MLALYACYCFFGIRFNNGISGVAELVVAALVATSVASFIIGEKFITIGFTGNFQPRQTLNGDGRHFIPSVPVYYLWSLVVVSSVFYSILTQGQPLRLLTDGVDLKLARLQDIAEKRPLLLNLDALVLAMTLLGLAWAILSYRDNRRSKFILGVSAILMFLYVLSTGSRTPLISVLLQVLPALSVARLRSRHMAWLSRKKWFFVFALLAGVASMIVITAARMKFEELNDDVFYSYFNVRDFGVIAKLLQSGDEASFFLATAVTYAASTFNNVVIRYQELDAITLSLGYKFLFFYLAAAQLLLPGLVPQGASEWRDLATTSKEHLESVSMAAGQWATPYGDLIWDFGVAGTFIIVAILGVVAGLIIGSARKNPSFKNILWQVMVIGFSLSPLVNSLLVLYVHYVLALLIFITFWSSRRSIGSTGSRRQGESLAYSRRSLQQT